LLWGYLRRTVYNGGIYRDITRGISLGCSLSPLMGALYLQPLDERMERLGVFYARFMDDWVVLAPTRWKLRAAIREVNEVMAECKVKQHPTKTYIGRICNVSIFWVMPFPRRDWALRPGAFGTWPRT